MKSVVFPAASSALAFMCSEPVGSRSTEQLGYSPGFRFPQTAVVS